MIRRFLRKVLLHFYPPKRGDVYFGDAFDFVIGKPLEGALHKTRTLVGEPLYDVIPGDDTYKIRIQLDAGIWYVCQCEVLAEDRNDRRKTWLRRSMSRRISRERFLSMILDDIIVKQEDL